jgi:hypothetical protein
MQKYCGCNKSMNEKVKVKKVYYSDTAQIMKESGKTECFKTLSFHCGMLTESNEY